MSVIRIHSTAWGAKSDLTGRYLKSYDPDARGGRGTVETTEDRDQAMQFADAGAAMECWRRPSKVLPLRPDGKPNRPLTAYNVEIEP